MVQLYLYYGQHREQGYLEFSFLHYAQELKLFHSSFLRLNSIVKSPFVQKLLFFLQVPWTVNYMHLFVNQFRAGDLKLD